MNIEWRGVEELMRKMQRRAEKLEDVSKEGMEEAVLFVHSKMPRYPAKLEGSRYRRTGRLGASVTTLSGKAEGALSRVEVLSGRTVGVIGTNIVYAPYVIGEGTQSRVHSGRWWTLAEVVRGCADGIGRILEKYVRRAIE